MKTRNILKTLITVCALTATGNGFAQTVGAAGGLQLNVSSADKNSGFNLNMIDRGNVGPYVEGIVSLRDPGGLTGRLGATVDGKDIHFSFTGIGYSANTPNGSYSITLSPFSLMAYEGHVDYEINAQFQFLKPLRKGLTIEGSILTGVTFGSRRLKGVAGAESLVVSDESGNALLNGLNQSYNAKSDIDVSSAFAVCRLQVNIELGEGVCVSPTAIYSTRSGPEVLRGTIPNWNWNSQAPAVKNLQNVQDPSHSYLNVGATLKIAL